ncbi:CHC2 zinc finger [Zunongwangia mangrovi]|uniref:CHC2 zinc finger n=1 Tax=Zunongwangia mangrovi TaxID=1334022 RepID=A0A1I1DRX5_9FLAO|nr:toprim domain-containing protein [Zunongwangia mangrovi]SFB75788.1 CHC2 zinc finger [Zunongwangia mangrovi]
MKTKKICCEHARNLDIVHVLAKLGHYPSKTTVKEAWFLSPLRSETQASFHVSYHKNRWYDFGLGKGGNCLDLIIALKQCSIAEALQFLANDQQLTISDLKNPSLSFHKQISKKKKEGINILCVQELSNIQLLRYAKKRGIPRELIRGLTSEVHFELYGKPYYAIGLQNRRGGYELRNAFYKASSSPKSYSYFQQNGNGLIITEGLFDYLSLALLDPELFFTRDHIILNSLSFIQEIIKGFEGYPDPIFLFLDHDAAGDHMTSYLLEHFAQAIDLRYRFYPHKDLNEKLCHVQRENTL